MQSVPDEVIERMVIRTLEQGGATFDITTHSLIEPDCYWYFPKHPSRTRIVDQDQLHSELLVYIEQNHDVCGEVDVWLGTWINPHSSKCYLDITTKLADKSEAIRGARRASETEARKIITIYNPELKQTEYVWDDVRF